MIESKNDLHENALKMKETEFKWLKEEFKKQRRVNKKYKKLDFEQFVDEFVSDMVNKVKTAREVLTV